MFSGIIEDIGSLKTRTERGEGVVFEFATALPTAEIKLGDSIAVNGCCLTVTSLREKGFTMFASHESLTRTNLSQLEVGTAVNLERALAVSARLDGHLVQGHVETTGTLHRMETRGDSLEIEVRLPGDLKPLVIPKGSIALDGVSLTVNWVRDESKAVVVGINLIPHTLKMTTLGQKAPGVRFNVETDLLGRYVQRAMSVFSDLSRPQNA